MDGWILRRALFTLLALLLLTEVVAESQIYKTGLIMASKYRNRAETEILTAVTNALLDSKRFDVIERSRLDAVFTERDLKDFIEGTPGDLSDLEGVDLLGLVSYTVERQEDRSEIVVIDIRLTEVRSGRVFASISSRRDSFDPPRTPHRAGVHLLANIREAFPPEGIVVDVSEKRVVIDLGVESGLKKGDELEVVRDGEVIFHPTTHNPLPAVEDVVGVLRVTKASRQLSICKLKKSKDAMVIQVTDRVRLKPKLELLRKAYSKIPFVKRKVKEVEREF